jgi:ribokinase
MSEQRVVVVGSINMDLVVRMARLPRPGETVHGQRFQTIPGGKGANQAVAMARLGMRVTLIGRVGDDSFGETLLRTLAGYGVDTQHVIVTPNCSSGVALIGVEASGANSITVIAGANGELTPADIASRDEVIRSADALVVQLETPIETVAAAIKLAREAHVRTILDPAPAPTTELPPEVIDVSIISPNQTEAESLTGIVVEDLDSAERAARRLRELGAHNVVLKLGQLGALLCDEEGRLEHVAAQQIKVIDTTAAGDAFTAGLTVAVVEERSWREAVHFGCSAGTLACLTPGAQTAMPTRHDVDRFMTLRPTQ